MYTQNNNSSMKTVVETFIVEETQELIYDNEKLEQWNKHVQELGLEGQTQIVVKDKSPIPFLHMKETLVNAFTVLCPRKVDLKKYDKTPIPVEILDLVALSLREGYFDRIQVWYDDKSPDPAVVGLLKKAEYKNTESDWEGYYEKYLLGRWADVKMSLDKLVEKARVLFVKSKKDQYEKSIKDYHRKLEDIEHEANRHLGFTEESGAFDFEF